MKRKPKHPQITHHGLVQAWRVELTDLQLDQRVSADVCCAYVDTNDQQIYLPVPFLGIRKMEQAEMSPLRPRGPIPGCFAEGIPCIALDWIEQTLPEYIGLWLRIRIQVDCQERYSTWD